MEECDRGLRFDRSTWELDLVHGSCLVTAEHLGESERWSCHNVAFAMAALEVSLARVLNLLMFDPMCLASFQTTSPNTSHAPISGPLSMLLQQPIACSTSCPPAELIYFLRLNSIATLGRSFLNPFKFWCVPPHITPISPMILQQNHSILRLLSFPRTKARGLKPSTLPAQVQILKPSDKEAAGEERKGWGKNGLESVPPGFFSLSSWRPVPMSEPFAFRVRK